MARSSWLLTQELLLSQTGAIKLEGSGFQLADQGQSGQQDWRSGNRARDRRFNCLSVALTQNSPIFVCHFEWRTLWERKTSSTKLESCKFILAEPSVSLVFQCPARFRDLLVERLRRSS